MSPLSGLTKFGRIGALAAAAAMVLAACSNGTSSSGGSSPAGSGGALTLSSMSISSVGTVLTAPDGRTLYILTADQGGTPTCTSSQCTGLWPPLTLPSGVSSPSAGSGVSAHLLGTVQTAAGGTQVTYNNWPVYMYSGDSGPGQASGEKIQAFGGTWYAMDASGKLAGAPASLGGMGSTGKGNSGGYGYGS